MHSPWRGWLLDMYLAVGLLVGAAMLFECCGPNAADDTPAAPTQNCGR